MGLLGSDSESWRSEAAGVSGHAEQGLHVSCAWRARQARVVCIESKACTCHVCGEQGLHVSCVWRARPARVVCMESKACTCCVCGEQGRRVSCVWRARPARVVCMESKAGACRVYGEQGRRVSCAWGARPASVVCMESKAGVCRATRVPQTQPLRIHRQCEDDKRLNVVERHLPASTLDPVYDWLHLRTLRLDRTTGRRGRRAGRRISKVSGARRTQRPGYEHGRSGSGSTRRRRTRSRPTLPVGRR